MLSGNVMQCQQDSMPTHTNRSILRIIRDLKYGKLANNIKVVEAWCYLGTNLSLKDLLCRYTIPKMLHMPLVHKFKKKKDIQFNVLEHIFKCLVLRKWTAESTKSFTGKCRLAVPSLKTAMSVQIFPQIICNFIN